MKIRVTEPSMIILVGASGSGKSTFARKHFKPTEILSSDFFRGLVSDDENDQTASDAAFDALHHLARIRLKNRKNVVIDATNVEASSRAQLLAIAREQHCLTSVIVLDLPFEILKARNATRADRNFGDHVLRKHIGGLRRSLRSMKTEGIKQITVLRSVEEVEAATLERNKLWNDRREDHGPFDIIGDVHGCYEELLALFAKLGWTIGGTREAPKITAPAGRRAIFLGDLVDRGPDSPGVLRLAMHMHAAGLALCVAGNHEIKLKRKLDGRDVKPTHGLKETLEQLEKEPPEFGAQASKFIDGLISHYVLDDGRLVVAHAGLSEELQGRASARVREFALYGDTTGETDEYGLPVRYPWASDYRGKASVIYGHTPVPEADWLNGTLCIDTGCVFGGKLTALRWPEKELVQVEAKTAYYAPIRPLDDALAAARARTADDLLDIDDVSDKRHISTRLSPGVTVRAENAAAALEVMCRFAVDPRWLIHLPPTMSPPKTAPAGTPTLERPEEALAYYRDEGALEVVCQEKHMGSRAIMVLARSVEAAVKRFRTTPTMGQGVIYTRTGRPFFGDKALEAEILARTTRALEATGLWSELSTDWVALDVELLPWSAKAQGLLEGQYAAVGAAARSSIDAVVTVLEQSVARRSSEAGLALLQRFQGKKQAVSGFVDAYRRYCWPVASIEDHKVAPFHLLASEGAVHDDKDHLWHLERVGRLSTHDPGLFRRTRHLHLRLDDPTSDQQAVQWWRSLVDAGGEGMVVKPLQYLTRGKHGLLQPAIKCRGPEYLRIIYGPEYLEPNALERLRARGLGHKRSMASRELALGLEALHRFVGREGLARVHECVFGVLALESEPVDPRL
ncbi:MAG: polynucleotide kinase-phosphatase [Myxococcota bacterium]